LAQGNAYSQVLDAHANKVGARVVRICGQVEAELSELDDEEKGEFLRDLGVQEPGLHRLIHAAYGLLNLITFFTAGEKEVRAWTVRQGALAPEAAGEIHSDFESNFIRAEVIPFATYIEVGGENNAKNKGLMQVEGKQYPVSDGDVMHFRVGV
jgi:ribosome-binding ATPase YchF (GTP1/OBG family)